MSEKKVRTHKDLDIWKQGIDLVAKVYKLTKSLPKEELYGLSSQMQRSAVSFTSNIAEGAARSSVSEYIRFLYISLGSLSELETHIMICIKLNYIKEDDTVLNEVELLRKMTLNFIKYLKAKG